MVRHLPWKRQASSQKQDGSETGPSLPSTRKAAPPDRRSVSSSARGPRQHILSDPARSPSTSPPPERPAEQFMVPGALDDDRYRMVEDEFLAVAQRFTAHLHRAEYERLKALARRRHAATLSEIERPVVAGLAPTAATRRRRESAQRAGRDGAEGMGMGMGMGLRRLMDAPGARGRDIQVLPASSRGTRAAAGFASSQGGGSQSQRVEGPLATAARGREGVGSVVMGGDALDRGKRRRVGFLPREDEGAEGREEEQQEHVDDDDDGDDDGDLFGIRARGLHRRTSTEQMKKAADEQGRNSQAGLDIIPAFL